MKSPVPLTQLREYEDGMIKDVMGRACLKENTQCKECVKDQTFYKKLLGTISRKFFLSKKENSSQFLDSSLRERMFSMGIVPGASIKRMGDCPLRNPVIININGQQVSLLKEEAALIMVETSL